ncbi:MAG: 4-hydroxy-tetrahydrodipicolinate synthase [Oceanospirillaceae bacterium]|nr:4-hydroxy-tetrahydrodipicolinate synthase [Oceanospirillaceae bacterium]
MITGSIVALVTPMTTSGEIDWPALDKLVEFHIENGTKSIVAVGTSGESATLSPTEHCAVIKRVVNVVAGRIPVIAGTGANNTQEAIELSKEAKALGVDACLSVVPYYNKPTQEGMYLHFKAIAEAVDIPQILYNVPGRTIADMQEETTLRLARDVTNIVGIKDATGDVARNKSLVANAPAGFAVYSGDDVTAVELMLAGGHGNISVTANVAPLLMSELCEVAIAGDAKKARALNDTLMGLHNQLFTESNPIPVKWAVAQLGLMEEGIRLPLTPLSEQYRAPLLSAMKENKLV